MEIKFPPKLLRLRDAYSLMPGKNLVSGRVYEHTSRSMFENPFGKRLTPSTMKCAWAERSACSGSYGSYTTFAWIP